MAYHEPSFLEGLAAGLTATAGCPKGIFQKHYGTGTDRLVRVPPGQFDTFVGKFVIKTPYAVTVSLEYGPDRNTPERVFRHVSASNEQQTFYHVVQIPTAVPLTDYHYNMCIHETADMARVIRFDMFFMAFPYTNSGGETISYPGSPELVRNWLVRTFR